MSNRNSRAFTLIEVLIALMIIAIALGAAIRATNSSIHTTIHVKNTMGAHWVGMNVLSAMQTGITPTPRPGNTSNGKTNLLGQEWHWTAQSEEFSQLPGVTKITVTVRLKNHSITSVTGYIEDIPESNT
ncbi:MAG: type II secretion system minor pseudopilin GspI [Gammaproteobacteria bacterium]|nr:type II secretion system minor pseudopilin GspI [Gammaproteobacteria bacterium]